MLGIAGGHRPATTGRSGERGRARGAGKWRPRATGPWPPDGLHPGGSGPVVTLASASR
jgi:hypothetical protein